MPKNAAGRWGLAILILAIVVPAAIFIALDGLDRAVSARFYVPGEGFAARFGSPYHLGVRSLVKIVVIASIVALILAGIWRVLLGRRLLGISRRIVAYLFLAMLIGPGLFANTLLKDNWGRARPSQIVEFGGTKIYSPPLLMADQCARNCSFVSGDASIGFILVALGFAATGRRWRTTGWALGLGLGMLFGYTRVAQGGHFLSDVYFAGVFMIAIAWLLYYLVVERDCLAPLFRLLPPER